MRNSTWRTAAAVVLGLLASAGASAQTGDVSSHPMIGEPAPAFDLDEVDGGSLSLESLRGRFVVIHFGASW